MIEETDSYLDGFDRTCINLSSTLVEPFCWAYGMLRYRSVSPLDPNKFENTSSKVMEIGIRISIFAVAVFALTYPGTQIALAVLGPSAFLFRAVGFALQKNQFTYIKGLLPEQALMNGQTSVMVWSLCGEWGRSSYQKGGVIPWQSRLDKIVEQIEAKNPDVLVLQEVNDTALVEALVQRLQSQYAHFFVHLGGSAWKKTNGCMVIAKCAVDTFCHRELSNQTNYEMFAIKAHPADPGPYIRFIGTQFLPGKKNEAIRTEQVAHIVRSLAQEAHILPTLLISTNADLGSPTEGAFLSKYLQHSYRAPEPTRTVQLALQWDPDTEQAETFDTISLFRRNLPDGTVLPVNERTLRMVNCEAVVPFNETYDTQRALAPDQGIVTVFDKRPQPVPVVG